MHSPLTFKEGVPFAWWRMAMTWPKCPRFSGRLVRCIAVGGAAFDNVKRPNRYSVARCNVSAPTTSASAAASASSAPAASANNSEADTSSDSNDSNAGAHADADDQRETAQETVREKRSRQMRQAAPRRHRRIAVKPPPDSDSSDYGEDLPIGIYPVNQTKDV